MLFKILSIPTESLPDYSDLIESLRITSPSKNPQLLATESAVSQCRSSIRDILNGHPETVSARVQHESIHRLCDQQPYTHDYLTPRNTEDGAAVFKGPLVPIAVSTTVIGDNQTGFASRYSLTPTPDCSPFYTKGDAIPSMGISYSVMAEGNKDIAACLYKSVVDVALARQPIVSLDQFKDVIFQGFNQAVNLISEHNPNPEDTTSFTFLWTQGLQCYSVQIGGSQIQYTDHENESKTVESDPLDQSPLPFEGQSTSALRPCVSLYSLMGMMNVESMVETSGLPLPTNLFHAFTVKKNTPITVFSDGAADNASVNLNTTKQQCRNAFSVIQQIHTVIDPTVNIDQYQNEDACRWVDKRKARVNTELKGFYSALKVLLQGYLGPEQDCTVTVEDIHTAIQTIVAHIESYPNPHSIIVIEDTSVLNAANKLRAIFPKAFQKVDDSITSDRHNDTRPDSGYFQTPDSKGFSSTFDIQETFV